MRGKNKFKRSLAAAVQSPSFSPATSAEMHFGAPLRYICTMLRGIRTSAGSLRVGAAGAFPIGHLAENIAMWRGVTELYGGKTSGAMTYDGSDKRRISLGRRCGTRNPPESASFPIGRMALAPLTPTKALLFEPVDGFFAGRAGIGSYVLAGGKATPIPGTYQEAEFLPDGRVVLADSQNLYLWMRGQPTTERLTALTGLQQAGTTDWLYEEEFGFTKAFSVAPSGAYVAYLSLRQ